MNRKRVLVVDDERSHRLMLRAHLEGIDLQVVEAASGEEALDLLTSGNESDWPDLVLLDLKMPGLNGIEVLERLAAKGVTLPVIIMTAHSSIESALKAGRLGIKHYLTKPLDTDELLVKIEEILKIKDVRTIQARRMEDLARKFDFNELLGRSPAMLELKEMLALVAPSEASVLITGESGTGKELVARAIQKNSTRKNKEFVTVNCAALPEALLESELFGHEKGAFTGAHQRKAGRFELADQGTLFMDEVGEMAQTTQAKLLRVLEDQSFERVGGTKTLKVNVRVLAATNRDLEEEIKGRTVPGGSLLQTQRCPDPHSQPSGTRLGRHPGTGRTHPEILGRQKQKKRERLFPPSLKDSHGQSLARQRAGTRQCGRTGRHFGPGRSDRGRGPPPDRPILVWRWPQKRKRLRTQRRHDHQGSGSRIDPAHLERNRWQPFQSLGHAGHHPANAIKQNQRIWA